MKKVLVTGSQGFIGSYVCAELLDRGYEVWGIDNYSKYGEVRRGHDDHPNFHLKVFDLINDEALSRMFSENDLKPNYILHLAARIGGIKYFHDYASELLIDNSRMDANMIDVAVSLHKEGALDRFVAMSSSMVFENTDIYPTPENCLDKIPPPSSTYGFSKLSLEYQCKGASEQYGLPYTIVRPFNCVGIGEQDAKGGEVTMMGNVKMLMSHVLPDLIHRALQLGPDDKMPILGSGEQVRHYTNGKDIARGIVMAMESDAAVNNDFNISSPVATTVRELAEMVWDKIHGTPLVFEHCDPYTYDVQVRSPNVRKAKEVLGFEAEIDLSDSVDEVIAWMKEQSNG